MLNSAEINEFIEIYQAEFGVKLDEQRAQMKAQELYEFMKILFDKKMRRNKDENKGQVTNSNKVI